MAIRDVRAVALGDLLGSLLSAVVEGQTAATASSLAFVREVGLEPGGDQPDRLRTVAIRYTKLDENQQPAEFVIDLPRPRDVAEIRLTPRFVELHEAIWQVLRDEVLKGYEQGKRAGAA